MRHRREGRHGGAGAAYAGQPVKARQRGAALLEAAAAAPGQAFLEQRQRLLERIAGAALRRTERFCHGAAVRAGIAVLRAAHGLRQFAPEGHVAHHIGRAVRHAGHWRRLAKAQQPRQRRRAQRAAVRDEAQLPGLRRRHPERSAAALRGVGRCRIALPVRAPAQRDAPAGEVREGARYQHAQVGGSREGAAHGRRAHVTAAALRMPGARQQPDRLEAGGLALDAVGGADVDAKQGGGHG
ncbi:hypothetical protein D3C81_1186200 [compost metagenome]